MSGGKRWWAGIRSTTVIDVTKQCSCGRVLIAIFCYHPGLKTGVCCAASKGRTEARWCSSRRCASPTRTPTNSSSRCPRPSSVWTTSRNPDLNCAIWQTTCRGIVLQVDWSIYALILPWTMEIKVLFFSARSARIMNPAFSCRCPSWVVHFWVEFKACKGPLLSQIHSVSLDQSFRMRICRMKQFFTQ
jgi:hypothetical protein